MLNIFISIPTEKYPKVSLKLMNVETCGSLSKNAKKLIFNYEFRGLEMPKINSNFNHMNFSQEKQFL